MNCTTCAAVADGSSVQRPHRGFGHPGREHRRAVAGVRQRVRSSGGSAATRSRSSTSIRRPVPPACCPSPETPTCAVGSPEELRRCRTDNKINAAYNYGPDPLIATIENTFGIQISHFVIIDFTGVVDLVNSVGGINLDFPYPVRDDDNGNNNSGLSIPRAGCQTLNGNTALALARSRFYEYEVRPGYWLYDGSGDLGRIQRQNVIIKAIIDKARSTYNPLTLNAFLGSVVHDVTVDQSISGSDLLALAEKYHAFSGSSLQTATIPTTGAYSSVAGDVEVVQEPAAEQTIAHFLGTQPSRDGDLAAHRRRQPGDDPPPTTAPVTPSTSPSGVTRSPPTTAVPGTGPFNPTPC